MRLYLNGKLTESYHSNPDWSALCSLVHSEFGPASKRISEKAKEMGFDFVFSGNWPKLEINKHYGYLDWEFHGVAKKLKVDGYDTRRESGKD